MKTQQDENPRYCQENRNNGHAIVTSLGPSVLSKDQTHTTVHYMSMEKSPIWMNQVRNSSIFKDSGKCKFIEKKRRWSLFRATWIQPIYVFTPLVLRTIFISSSKRRLCLRCVISSLHVMFVSPLMNLFATCLMILRMLEHNKHGFLFIQSVW